MASNTYSLRFVGDTAELAKKLAEIPGMTQRQAARAALKQIEENRKAAQKLIADQEAAAKKSADAWSEFAGGLNFSVTAGDLVNLGRSALDLVSALSDAQNEIADVAASSGLAASTIKGLQLAMEGSGDTLADLGPALNQFPKRLQDAARGAGEAKPAFEALGLSQADLAEMAKDSDAAFRDLVARVAAIENPTQRAATATMLFGEASSKLLQAGLGEQGALETFIAHADRFGLETGPRAAAQADRWQRALAELKLVVQGVGSQLADEFGPDTSKLMEDFTLGVVAGFEFVRFSVKAALQDLNFLRSALEALVTGKASFADVAREAQELAERQGEAGQAALENVLAFRDQRAAILESTGAIEGANGATGEYTDVTYQNAAAVRAAEQAERDRIKAVQDAEKALRSVSDANAQHYEGDAARRDQQLRDLAEQQAQVEAAGLRSVESDKVFADARLRVWEGFWAKQDEAQRKADEEAAKLADQRHQDALRRLEELAAAEAARRAEAIAGAQQVAESALALTAELAQQEYDRRTSTAADIRAQLEDEDANLSASKRRELEERLAAEEKAATRAFEVQKQTAAVQAAISGLLAAQRALELGPIAGPVAALLIGGLTAANIAAIETQEPPQFHRGTDEVPATLRRGEAVLTPAAVDRLGGRERVRAANRGESMGGGVTEIKLQLNRDTLQTVVASVTGRPGEARRKTGGRVGHRGKR